MDLFDLNFKNPDQKLSVYAETRTVCLLINTTGHIPQPERGKSYLLFSAENFEYSSIFSAGCPAEYYPNDTKVGINVKKLSMLRYLFCGSFKPEASRLWRRMFLCARICLMEAHLANDLSYSNSQDPRDWCRREGDLKYLDKRRDLGSRRPDGSYSCIINMIHKSGHKFHGGSNILMRSLM